MEPGLQQRALHLQPAQGIGPVQHHHGLSGPGAVLHGIGKGIKVGVEPRAHVLHVKDEYVKGCQHFLGQMGVFAKTAEYGQAGIRIDEGIHLLAGLNIAPHPMLAGEQGRQAMAAVKQVDGGAQAAVHAGGIGHQPQPCPGKILFHAAQVFNARLCHKTASFLQKHIQ